MNIIKKNMDKIRDCPIRLLKVEMNRIRTYEIEFSEAVKLLAMRLVTVILWLSEVIVALFGLNLR